MDWVLLGSIGSFVGGLGSLIAVVVAIGIYQKTAKAGQDLQAENMRLERIRATLRDFPQLRRSSLDFEQKVRCLRDEERTEYLKNQLGQLELFAVGVNMEAYSIEVVSRMSGGRLIRQHKQYFKAFIQARRSAPHMIVKPENLYCEYEAMMKRLYEMRGLPWEG